ncbi:MAG: hypothetical protein IPL52_08305 [Flavobacteriales bacterium]|nr:hypothetical protein [Flavobacteriales bacterium]
MGKMRSWVLLATFCVAVTVNGQTFDVEQFEQVFRPRVRMDVRHQFQSDLQDTTGHFSNSEGSVVFTFPIRSRFEVGLKLDTTARDFGDLLKRSLQVRASQLLGSARFGARQIELGFDSVTDRQLFTGSIGLMGIKLTKKYRVLFWSANVNVSEEEATLDEATPRFNGVIGKMHLNGLRRTFFYGVGLSYTDKLTLPVPFIGGSAPIGSDWSFQYVLPAQVAVGFAPQKRTRFLAGIGLDAFRSGVSMNDARTNLNHGTLRAFLNVRHKAGNHVQVRAEIGYDLVRTVRFTEGDVVPHRYPVEPGLVAGVGVNVFFGNNVFERIMDAVVN